MTPTEYRTARRNLIRDSAVFEAQIAAGISHKFYIYGQPVNMDVFLMFGLFGLEFERGGK